MSQTDKKVQRVSKCTNMIRLTHEQYHEVTDNNHHLNEILAEHSYNPQNEIFHFRVPLLLLHISSHLHPW